MATIQQPHSWNYNVLVEEIEWNTQRKIYIDLGKLLIEELMKS